MKNLYLVLTILGAIVPYLFFFQFIQTEGIDVAAFSAAMFVNGAAGGISADLLLSSFIFWVFMFQQLRKKGSPKPYAFIVLNLFIGLSCALPAYLYVRERPESMKAG
ncbi:MAG: DUF2834 domain-containing protein [Gammaproteobacteria bacterium]|nr:DUF2834 domain-containing protein [Gammaproteobacteria bacterium]